MVEERKAETAEMKKSCSDAGASNGSSSSASAAGNPGLKLKINLRDRQGASRKRHRSSSPAGSSDSSANQEKTTAHRHSLERATLKRNRKERNNAEASSGHLDNETKLNGDFSINNGISHIGRFTVSTVATIRNVSESFMDSCTDSDSRIFAQIRGFVNQNTVVFEDS